MANCEVCPCWLEVINTIRYLKLHRSTVHTAFYMSPVILTIYTVIYEYYTSICTKLFYFEIVLH